MAAARGRPASRPRQNLAQAARRTRAAADRAPRDAESRGLTPPQPVGCMNRRRAFGGEGDSPCTLRAPPPCGPRAGACTAQPHSSALRRRLGGLWPRLHCAHKDSLVLEDAGPDEGRAAAPVRKARVGERTAALDLHARGSRAAAMASRQAGQGGCARHVPGRRCGRWVAPSRWSPCASRQCLAAAPHTSISAHRGDAAGTPSARLNVPEKRKCKLRGTASTRKLCAPRCETCEGHRLWLRATREKACRERGSHQVSDQQSS
jgi:hypothetical protein